MRKTLLAFMAFATLVLTGCGHSSAPSLSPLQARADSLGEFVIATNLGSVLRVMVSKDDSTVVLNSQYRYYFYGSPESNEVFLCDPGALAYPLFLSLVDSIDTVSLLPAVYRRFDSVGVCDTRFIRDSAQNLVDMLTIRHAFDVTSNVAFVTLLDEQFGNRRSEFLERLRCMLGESVVLPDALDLCLDSVWFDLLQGRGFQMNMSSIINCYRKLPTSIIEMLPQVDDGVLGLPALVVGDYGRTYAMFIGLAGDLIGLVILENSRTYALFAQELFLNLVNNEQTQKQI